MLLQRLCLAMNQRKREDVNVTCEDRVTMVSGSARGLCHAQSEQSRENVASRMTVEAL